MHLRDFLVEQAADGEHAHAISLFLEEKTQRQYVPRWFISWRRCARWRNDDCECLRRSFYDCEATYFLLMMGTQLLLMKDLRSRFPCCWTRTRSARSFHVGSGREGGVRDGETTRARAGAQRFAIATLLFILGTHLLFKNGLSWRFPCCWPGTRSAR